MKNLACLTCVAALLLVAAPAQAAQDADLVEKVVVKNRLHTLSGKWELGVHAGFSLMPRLTDHYNLGASLAWNVAEVLALELRAGYAISRHTGLADQISADFFQSVVSGGVGASNPVTDLSDLWEMTLNFALGLRFQPIYGKISLFSEVALHFQLYLWVGGGAGLFKRDSVVICSVRTGNECTQWYGEQKFGPVVSLALGMRFWVPGVNWLSVKFEARDWSFLDSYLTGVNRQQALNPATPEGGGTPYQGATITNLVQFEFGPTFTF